MIIGIGINTPAKMIAVTNMTAIATPSKANCVVNLVLYLRTTFSLNSS